MAKVKLKNVNGEEVLYDNVFLVKLKDENDNDVSFYTTLYQKTIFMATTNDYYSSQENNSGVATTMPAEPVRSGYIFRGWSSVDNNYVLANKVTFPQVFNSDTTLYAMWVETPSGATTISGLGSEITSDIVWVTDASFEAVIADIIAGNYDETDAYGNVFVKFPTVYRKILSSESGQITSIALSFTQLDSDYEPYSCFVKPDGETVMSYIYIGKYGFTSTSSATSVSGSAVDMTLGAARLLAQAVGTGYQLYDWQMHRLVQDLCVAYYKTINKKGNVLGLSGINAWTWADGFAKINGTWVCAYDTANYVDRPTSNTNGYSLVGYSAPTSSNIIKKLGYDSNHPFFNYPNEVGTTSNTYYVDEYYYGSGNRPVRIAAAGVWLCDTNNAWDTASSVRLCYRPIV